MADAYLAGVDVGGSGIRVRAGTKSQAISFEAHDQGPVPRRYGLIDVHELSVRITGLIREALCTIGTESLQTIAIGLTGMPGRLDSAEELAKGVMSFDGLRRIVIASDALTTHIGALGGAAGSVVAAGTGAIALGTDHDDVWNRVDGWGPSVGDEGSGAWIGARGITAAIRCRDGRERGSSRLLRILEAEFGDVRTAVQAVNGSSKRAHMLARFAPGVAAAAGEGDPVAQAIWADAGRLLAQSVHAASIGVEKVFSWGGGLFTAGELLLAPFRAELLRLDPDANLVPPAGRSVDGAMSLACSRVHAASANSTPYIAEFSTTAVCGMG